MGMETPYTLLALPQPLDSINGRTWSAPAVTLNGSRKRKRNELVVGTDGESVNVYQINNQSLLSAYALPPRTYICCDPVSCCTRSKRTTVAQRDTFVVLKDGLNHKRPRLVRFQEKASSNADFVVPVKSEFALPEGDVGSINVLPSQSLGDNQSPQILAVYENGEVICISQDMSRALWRQSLSLAEGSMVSEVFLEDVIAAQKGILRNREDLVASLQLSDADATVLACFIVRTPVLTSLHLYSVTAGAIRGGLHHLDTIELPEVSVRHTQSSWTLLSSAGLLFELCQGSIYAYDLTGITPRLHLVLREKSKTFTSFTPISQSLLVATTLQKAFLYDLNYGSVQASMDLPMNSTLVRKRKRQDEAVSGSNLSLHWFSELNTIIAASTSLSGMQLKPDMLRSSRTSIQLASVVGKDSDGEPAHFQDEGNTLVRRNKWQDMINKHVTDGNIKALETVIAQDFQLDVRVPSSDENTTDDEASLWDIEDRVIDLGVNQKPRALALLHLLFTCDSTLQLRIPCRNILRWLYAVDILTSANLSIVLGRHITTQDVVQALVAADPNFLLIQDILMLSVHLPMEFSIEALRLLIRSLGDKSADQTALAVAQQSTELVDETETAEAELQNAILTLEAGLEIRSSTMGLLFGRLHAFPKLQLVQSLRNGLQLKDLVFFIHLLRLELASAGWTRPYVEVEDASDTEKALVYPGSEDEAPSDHAVRTIGNLLLAAVDAIGPNGWLVGLATSENEDELLDALRAEVAATMEGVYEAHAIQSYLDEFERYATIASTVNKPQSRGEIEVHSASDDKILMPLGGRSQVIARETSSRRRSEVPKHIRAKHMDAEVGLYQFERIRV